MADASNGPAVGGQPEGLTPREGVGPFVFDEIQAEVDALTRARLAQGRGGLVIAPTGFGKGVLVASTVRDMLDGVGMKPRADGRRPRVLMIVPSLDLVGQNLERLHEAGVIGDDDVNRVGVMCQASKRPYWPGSGRKVRARVNPQADVVIATQASVARMLDTPEGKAALADFNGALFDEAHRGAAKRIGQALKLLTQNGAVLMGLTATPFREDGADVAAMFGGEDAVIRQVTRKEAIDCGRIVPGKLIPDARREFRDAVGREDSWAMDRRIEEEVAAGKSLDQASEKAVGKLFQRLGQAEPGSQEARTLAAVDEKLAEDAELARRMIEATIDVWAKYAPDRVSLVHAENRAHARALFDGFASTEKGGRPLNVLSIDGEEVRVARAGEVEVFTGAEAARKRAEMLDEARAGKFDVVTNCQVLREGVDIPCASASINACMNKGLVSMMQAVVGRTARSHTDPETGERKADHMILDLGNTIARLANRDPRFKAGDVDMRGVAETAISMEYAAEMLDSIDEEGAGLSQAAADFAEDTDARFEDEARREAPGLPDDPAEEGVEVIREVDHAGAPDPLGSGERVYTEHKKSGSSGPKLGSGTVLGVDRRGPDGAPEYYSVFFDRHGVKDVPAAALEPIRDVRARGGMKAEDKIQARWAAAGDLPESVSEVLDAHADAWRAFGSPDPDLRPGGRFVSWARSEPNTLAKGQGGVYLHALPNFQYHGYVRVRFDDGRLAAIPGRTIARDAWAREKNLFRSLPDGREVLTTPGSPDALQGGRPRDGEGTPMFELGERVFALPAKEQADGTRAAGYGMVVGFAEQDPRGGHVRQYEILFEDGTTGLCGPRGMMGEKKALGKRLGSAEVAKHWEKIDADRRAKEEKAEAFRLQEERHAEAERREAERRAEEARRLEERARARAEAEARRAAARTQDFESLGRGYSAERVADHVARREANARDEDVGSAETPTPQGPRFDLLVEEGASKAAPPAARTAARDGPPAAAGDWLVRVDDDCWVASATKKTHAGSLSNVSALLVSAKRARRIAGLPEDGADGWIGVTVDGGGQANGFRVDDPSQAIEQLNPVRRQAEDDPWGRRVNARLAGSAPSDKSLKKLGVELAKSPAIRGLLAGWAEGSQWRVAAGIHLASRGAAISREIGRQAGLAREAAEEKARAAEAAARGDDSFGRADAWFRRIGAVIGDTVGLIESEDCAEIANEAKRTFPDRKVCVLGLSDHPPHAKLVDALKARGMDARLETPETLEADGGDAAAAMLSAVEKQRVWTMQHPGEDVAEMLRAEVANARRHGRPAAAEDTAKDAPPQATAQKPATKGVPRRTARDGDSAKLKAAGFVQASPGVWAAMDGTTSSSQARLVMTRQAAARAALTRAEAEQAAVGPAYFVVSTSASARSQPVQQADDVDAAIGIADLGPSGAADPERFNQVALSSFRAAKVEEACDWNQREMQLRNRRSHLGWMFSLDRGAPTDPAVRHALGACETVWPSLQTAFTRRVRESLGAGAADAWRARAGKAMLVADGDKAMKRASDEAVDRMVSRAREAGRDRILLLGDPEHGAHRELAERASARGVETVVLGPRDLQLFNGAVARGIAAAVEKGDAKFVGDRRQMAAALFAKAAEPEAQMAKAAARVEAEAPRRKRRDQMEVAA